MFKYIIIYIFTFYSFCFSQVVNPVTITVNSDSSARAGEVVNINILADMDKEWKVYSIYKIVDGPLPTEISITGDAISLVGRILEPDPTEEYDPGFDVTSFYHSGSTNFSTQVLLKNKLY